METRGLSLWSSVVFLLIVLNAQLSISLNAQEGSKNHAIKININPNCSQQMRCHSNYIDRGIIDKRFKRSPVASAAGIRVFKYVEYDSSISGSGTNKSTASLGSISGSSTTTTTKIPKTSPSSSPIDRSLIPNKFFGQTESAESKVYVVNTAKPFDSVVDITEDLQNKNPSKYVKNSQEISKRIETREPLFGPPPPPPPRPPLLPGLIPPKLPQPQPYTSSSDFYEHEFDRDSKAAETMTGWIPRILKQGPRLRQRQHNQNGQMYSGSSGSRNPYYPTQRQSSSRHRLQKPLPRPSGSRYGNSKLRQRQRHQNQNRQRKGHQNVKKYPQGPPRFASILRQRIRRPLMNLNRSPLNPLNRGHAAQNQVPYTYPKNAANIQDIIHHFDRENNDLGPGQHHGEASGMDDGGGLSKELQDVHTSLLKDIREFAKRPILMNQDSGNSNGNKAEKSQSQNKPTKYRHSNQNPSRKQNHYTISREREREHDREVQENDNSEDPWEPQPKPVRDMVRTQNPPQDFQDGTSSEEEYHFHQHQLARERDRDRDRDRELKFKKKRTRQRQREIEEELRREREWAKAKAKTRHQVYHNESPENYMDDMRNYRDRDMQPYPTSSSEEFVNSRPVSKSNKNRYQDPEPEETDSKYRGRERKKPYSTRSQNVPVVIKTPFRSPHSPPVEHDDDGYDVATKRYYNTQEYYPPNSPYDQGAEPAAPVVEIHTGPSFPPTSTPSFTHQSNSLHPHDKHWQRLYMEYLLSQQQPRRPLPPTNNRLQTTNKPMRMKIHIYPNGNGEPGPPQHDHDTSRSASESNGQNYGQSSRILPLPQSNNILDKSIYSTYPSPPGHYQNQNGIGTNIQIPPYPIRNPHSSSNSKVRSSPTTDRPVESKKVGGVVLHLHVHSNGNGENANRRSDTVSSHREHLYDDEDHEIEGDLEAHGSSIHQKTATNFRDRYKYQDEQMNEDDQEQSYEEQQQSPAQVDKTISMELPVKDGKINHVLSTLLNLREQN